MMARSTVSIFFLVLQLVSVLANQQCYSPARVGCVLPSLVDASLEDLASGLVNKQFASVDLVSAYIARINEVNSTLHVVTEINPDALTAQPGNRAALFTAFRS